MAKNATRDLTVGSPMKLILSFMLPLLFGLLFQQFYSMVDTVVVGKFLGVDAHGEARLLHDMRKRLPALVKRLMDAPFIAPGRLPPPDAERGEPRGTWKESPRPPP